eukprot:NODE_299_length_10456_cov_1.003669.p12 type:complete len:143 gc:universal NODE_299_length_10456_cov_1.003669:2256-2684(+)
MQRHLLTLTLPSGKLTAGPPLGPAFGQRGLKAIDFTKQFNAQTAHYVDKTPLKCNIEVDIKGRQFQFQIKSPPTSYLVKKCIGLDKGGQKGEQVAEISTKEIYHVAETKLKSDPTLNLKFTHEGLCRSIVGSCRGMGVKVVE